MNASFACLQGLGFSDGYFNFKCYSANFLVSCTHTHALQDNNMPDEILMQRCAHTGKARRPNIEATAGEIHCRVTKGAKECYFLPLQRVSHTHKLRVKVFHFPCVYIIHNIIHRVRQHTSALPKNRSNTVAVVSMTPSVLAHDFVQSTCGSIAGYESDVSDSTFASIGQTVSFDDDESLYSTQRKRDSRQLTIFPSSPPSETLSPHKVPTTPTRPVLRHADTVQDDIFQVTPTLQMIGKANTLLADISPSHCHLEAKASVPIGSKYSVSPMSSPKRNNRTANTLGSRLSPLRRRGRCKAVTTSSYFEDLIFNPPGHIISSPIATHSDSSSTTSGESCGTAEPAAGDTPTSPWTRVNAIKRKTLQDLGVEQPVYDVGFVNHCMDV